MKDAGLELSDIRGGTEVRRRTVEPAPWEQALADVVDRPESMIGASLTVVLFGVALALAAGSLAYFVAGLALAIPVAKAVKEIGLFDPQPRDELEVVERPGMTDREVQRLAVLHDEHERIKAEQAEQQRKRITNLQNHG